MNNTVDKKLAVESMKNMTIDEIVELYCNGCIIETSHAQQIEDVAHDPIIIGGIFVLAALAIGFAAGRENVVEKAKSLPACSPDCITRL